MSYMMFKKAEIREDSEDSDVKEEQEEPVKSKKKTKSPFE